MLNNEKTIPALNGEGYFTANPEEGVFFFQNGKNGSTKKIFLSSYFDLKSIGFDAEDNHYLVFEAPHMKKNKPFKQCLLEPEELGDREGWKKLKGIAKIQRSSKALDLLTNYINTLSKIKEKEQVFSSISEITGWSGENYIYPNGEVIYNSNSLSNLDESNSVYLRVGFDPQIKSAYQSIGTAEDFINKVIAKTEGNPFFTFAIACALTPPLLKFFQLKGCGFHIHGKSSAGKSTMQIIGQAIWGDPTKILQWKTTQYALAGNCMSRNDSPAIIDDLTKDEKCEACSNLIYILDGDMKSAGTIEGKRRIYQKFRILLFSSGEKTIREHIKEKLKRDLTEGERVRCPEILFSPPTNFHDFTNGEDYVRYIEEACNENHGTLAKEFIQKLVNKGKLKLKQELKETFQRNNDLPQKYKLDEIEDKDKQRQIARTTKSFTALKATLDYCNKLRLFGDYSLNLGDIDFCYETWFKATWEENQDENISDMGDLSPVFLFISQNKKRFINLTSEGEEEEISKSSSDFVGYSKPLEVEEGGEDEEDKEGKEGEIVYFIPTVLLNSKFSRTIIKTLLDKRYLIPNPYRNDKDKNLGWKEKQFKSGQGSARYYCLRETLPDDEE